MSQTPLLSIVAAVYNGEKFLAQFFECLEQQQLESYELILVNDGSTDNSLAVIAEWRDRLQNVQVLEQENQGVSVARNTGLAAASGKYLAFPDIDDKLYPGMYRTLLEMAEKEHLDIATCNGTYVYEKRRESHPIFPLDRLPSTGVLPGHVWLKQALDSRKFLHVTWLNIYRHDFIRITSISNPACAIRISRGRQRRCWPRSACSTPASSSMITTSTLSRCRISRTTTTR